MPEAWTTGTLIGPPNIPYVRTCCTVNVFLDAGVYFAVDWGGGVLVDSGADYATVVNAAIVYVGGLGGGKVFLHAGDHNVTSRILINYSEITLQGEGKGTRLYTTGMSDSFIVIGDTATANYVVVCDLQIDGTNQTKDADGIENTFQGHGVYAYCHDAVDTLYPIITGLYIANVANEGIAFYGRPVTFEIYGLVTENYVADFGYRGIHPHNDTSTSIINNYLYGGVATSDNAIRHGLVIAGNTVNYFGGAGPDGDAIMGGDRGSVIANNYIINSNAPKYGIHPWNDGSLVVGNIIEGGSYTTCAIYALTNTLVSDNRLRNIASCAVNVGMIAVGNNNVIMNNHIINCGTAANNTYDMIVFGASTYALVCNNYIFSNVANKPRYGIQEFGACDFNIIRDNTIIGMATAPVLIVGVNTKLPTIVVPFVDGSDPSDSGFQVLTDDTHYARTFLWLPLEVQQVVRMKVYARAAGAGAGAGVHMRAQFIIYGGADNESYTTHTGSIDNHPSTSENFAADDVIYWTITTAGVLALLGGDSVEVRVQHAAAGDSDVVTNAYMRTVAIEYV